MYRWSCCCRGVFSILSFLESAFSVVSIYVGVVVVILLFLFFFMLELEATSPHISSTNEDRHDSTD